MKGILIIAHGSREPETVKTMEEVFSMVKEKLSHILMEQAYMEFCDVNLAKGLDKLVKQGADNIVVVPYFLFSGIHIREDIPHEIEEYLSVHPGIKVTLGHTLGADPRIAEVLCDRVQEAL